MQGCVAAGTSFQDSKATLVSHYAAALQAVLAQSLPPPPPRPVSERPSWNTCHTPSSSSDAAATSFDLGSNPHLTPRYSQGVAAFTRQSDSAPSHSYDDTQHVDTPLKTSVIASSWLPASYSQRHVCPRSSHVRIRDAPSSHRSSLASSAASCKARPCTAHARQQNSSMSSQAGRVAGCFRGPTHRQQCTQTHKGRAGSRASYGLHTADTGTS